MDTTRDMEQATEIANAIERVCAGRPTVPVYMALSMVLGAAAAKAGRPDFDGMMRLVENAARWTFEAEIERP